MKRTEGALEVLDGELPASELAATLADIDRLNAWFGGHALTRRRINRLTADVPHDRALSVADVGGGTAAFAVRLAEWARRHRRPIRIVVVERYRLLRRISAALRLLGARPSDTIELAGPMPARVATALSYESRQAFLDAYRENATAVRAAYEEAIG